MIIKFYVQKHLSNSKIQSTKRYPPYATQKILWTAIQCFERSRLGHVISNDGVHFEPRIYQTWLHAKQNTITVFSIALLFFEIIKVITSVNPLGHSVFTLWCLKKNQFGSSKSLKARQIKESISIVALLNRFWIFPFHCHFDFVFFHNHQSLYV